jgi:hypothetical protein
LVRVWQGRQATRVSMCAVRKSASARTPASAFALVIRTCYLVPCACCSVETPAAVSKHISYTGLTLFGPCVAGDAGALPCCQKECKCEDYRTCTCLGHTHLGRGTPDSICTCCIQLSKGLTLFGPSVAGDAGKYVCCQKGCKCQDSAPAVARGIHTRFLVRVLQF